MVPIAVALGISKMPGFVNFQIQCMSFVCLTLHLCPVFDQTIYIYRLIDYNFRV